jgi:hypothetical protein
LTIAVLSVGLGAVAALFAGTGVAPRPAGRDLDLRLDLLCLAAAVGAGLTTVVAVAAGLLGLPVFGGASIVIPLAIGILGRWLLPRRAWTVPPAPPDSPWILWLSRAVLAAALALFAWKIARAPLWSWDHYAVWGMKARHLAEGDFLNLSFLRAYPFRFTNPEYPIGVPVLWRLLSVGRMPSSAEFKLCHVLFGIVLAGLCRLALRRGGVPAALANAAAAFVAISPLSWDTESLGLAEMPLAAAALAAVVLILPEREAAERLSPWLAGFALGVLPWIKPEGLTLAIFLLAAGWAMRRRRTAKGAFRGRTAALVLVFLAVAGATILLQRPLPPGQPFLDADWPQRFSERAPHVLAVVRKMASELAAPDWIGFWPAFGLAVLWAVRRRDRRVLALAAAVAAQTGLYLFVYLGTYVEPGAHIRSSFFRLMSALLPMAAVAAALSAGVRGSSTAPAPPATPRIPRPR